jgi:cyclic beta-1,2-glucan synthetase
MNIQTDPRRIKDVVPSFPAVAEQPIRATVLHEDRLRATGESLARKELRSYFGLEAFDFHARIRESAKKILQVYRDTNAAQGRGEPITPAAQWLLDNNYLVEETIYQVKRDLPKRFYRELPTIDLGDGQSVPRALAIAWIYVAHSDSTVSAQMFKAIVEGYQSVEPLHIGELWALPSLLRFVLVENLRRIAVRVNRAREMRAIANDVADRLQSVQEQDDGLALLKAYAAHARDTTFATQLLYRLRDGSQNAGKALIWLENELEKSGSDAEEIIIGEHHTLSSGNVTTGNIIRGLRLINDQDWTLWFEDVSRVDTLLRERTNFAALDFASRDQYRTAIEELARHSKLSEFQVAERATDFAHTETPASAEDRSGLQKECSDVGFFLVGPRRQELEQAIGYRPTIGRIANRAFRKTNWLGIALPVFALTVLLLFLAGNALAALGLPTAAVVVMLVLFSVPASEGALAFFNTIVLKFLEPTRLIGYEFKDGVPAEARTLVVVPSLIGSRDDVEENIRNIEVHHLANRAGEIHFALLSDWPDSQTEIDCRRPRNARLRPPRDRQSQRPLCLATATAFLSPAPPPALQSGARCWMGWERKRGKLHELNLLLRGDRDTTFLPGADVPLPENVVCDDARCRYAPDARHGHQAGRQALPSAQPPGFDPEEAPRRRGYAILQPRVTPSLTTGDDASFFQRVFSINRGLDPYVFAVSDVYQDVFGEGTFTGKGLYHVDAFEAALKGRIEENTVLSHDLLEGSLARCGARHRCRTGRGLSDPLFGRCLAPASLGAWRLAAAAATCSDREIRRYRRCRAGRWSTICAAR